MGLETIHNESFMHRDFHSGNILFDSDDTYKNGKWKTGDLGLSQAVNNKSSNDEFGILDGERPKITEDTPECYANLMKSCWDPDPKKRPSIKEIRLAFGDWVFRGKNKAEFDQAETKRMELIKSKKIGPEFAEKPHPRAIYTSRSLSALISKCSSIYSIIPFDSNYISRLGNNTNTISLSSQNLNSTIQNFSSSLDSNYITEELELDIESLSSQNLNSTIQNFSTSKYISAELELDIESLSSTNQNFQTSLVKRRIESLNVETHDDSGKYVKK
ncbi:unnamed protein product [Rhizophagus irregularis]|nr:unnamed protein product [Rhizophagus irregularis]